MEQWKDIKGFEGLYQVSNQGQVKNKKGKILKPRYNPYGRVILCNNGVQKNWLIHRLVFQAFKDPLIQGLVIDHKDDNPQNNHESNLQQITHRENIFKHSSHKGVTWCATSKKWRARIQIKGSVIQLGRHENKKDAIKAYQNTLKQHTNGTH